MNTLHELCAHRETVTPGGLVIDSRCLARHDAGGAVWLLWADRLGRVNMGNWIELAVADGEDGWRRTTEADGFARCDCPLEWLEGALVIDRDWRDRVWR